MEKILIELVAIFISLVLSVFVAERFRLPQVVGVLLAGAIIGPYSLGLVGQSETINSFSEIGAVLLLFVIGIEFSINKIVQFGVKAILVALVKLGLVFIMVYELMLLFSFSPVEAIAMGAIFSISSTTIFSKIVKGFEITRKEEIGMLFAVLIIEDIFAVFLLAFFSSLPNGVVNFALSDIALSIVKSLLVLVTIYFIVQKAFGKFFDYIINFKTEEMLVFSSLALCALFAFFANLIGLAPSIGAFLAGSMVAGLRDFKRIERTMLPFGLFFSSFFFLSIGMLVDPASILQNFLMIVVLVIVTVAAKFGIMAFSSYALGQRGNSAVFSGISMISVGEFSILLAKQTFGTGMPEMIGIVSASVFITSLLSAMLINKENLFVGMITNNITNQNREEARRMSRYVRGFVIQIEPQGSLFRTYVAGGRNFLVLGVLLLLINGSLLLMFEAASAFALIDIERWEISMIRWLLHVLLSVSIVIEMIKTADTVTDNTLDFIGASDRKNLRLDKRIMFDVIACVLLVIVSAILPWVFSILKLPQFFNHLSLIPLSFMIGFVWDGLKTLHEIVKERLKRRADDYY